MQTKNEINNKEPKYKVGQTVYWLLAGGKLTSGVITNIKLSKDTVYKDHSYLAGDRWHLESEFFESKEKAVEWFLENLS